MNNSNLVDVDFLARFFNKDARTVQLWAKFDGMPKEERGLYDFVKCVRWRVAKLEEKIEELEKGDVTLYKLKQEYQKLQNEEKRLDLDKQQNNLLDAETVELVNVSFVKMIVRNLNSIGPRLNKNLNGDAKTLSVINTVLDEFKNFCASTQISYFKEDIKKQEEEN